MAYYIKKVICSRYQCLQVLIAGKMPSLRLLLLTVFSIFTASADQEFPPHTPTSKPQPPEPSSTDRLLARVLYLPLPNSKGQILGYYTYIPYQLLGQAFPFSNQEQILLTLRQKGLFPFTDQSGRLFGFYTSTVGGSHQQPDVKELTAGLHAYGLYPLENGRGEIVAIYSTNPSFAFGPTGFHNAFQQYNGQE